MQSVVDTREFHFARPDFDAAHGYAPSNVRAAGFVSRQPRDALPTCHSHAFGGHAAPGSVRAADALVQHRHGLRRTSQTRLLPLGLANPPGVLPAVRIRQVGEGPAASGEPARTSASSPGRSTSLGASGGHCCIERCPAILTARLPVGRRADDAVERAGAPDHPEAVFCRRQARPRTGRSLVKITG